jgi:phosphate:Na+ symporter
MIENLNSPSYDSVSKKTAVAAEDAINDMRDELRNLNLSMIGNADYDVKSAMIFNNVFSSLEKIGDHIINISESIVGEI